VSTTLISCRKLIHNCISQLSTGLLGYQPVSFVTIKNRAVVHWAIDNPLGLLTTYLIRSLFDPVLKHDFCVKLLILDILMAIFSKPINRVPFMTLG